jgi:DNA-binding CsgD family transcriptional regulator
MKEAFLEVYGQYGSPLDRVLGPVIRPRSYLRTLHLLAMFPLGLAYFVVLVTAFSVGGAMIWTIVGPIVLIVALFFVRWAGDIEAWMARHVARIELRRPPTRLESGLSWREQVTTRLIDPTTWTGLVYLFLQFPVGLAYFVAIVVLGSFSLSALFAPAVVAIAERFSDETAVDFFDGAFIIETPLEGAWLVLPGAILFILSVHLIVNTSALHAVWARRMLGSRARQIAATEQPVPPDPEPSTAHPVPSETPAPTGGGAVGEALTSRETEVLGYLSRGYSNADIAETLVISEGTVKTHVKRILAKLQASNRTEAALMARDRGLSPPQVNEDPVVVPLRRYQR